ncbi:two-component system sensor protein [Leifsonia xyli subsp. cynodontis DSM 46306]|uniref:Uncharacterized protein n=1 Tax=Leifsonia xyli subsp. cynodontis DSM 46306 TaxID=1389489 RepID=U3P8N0_LEIXC|nr:two-component system sensor protein [Leifsonia xyli subsp. cynodontis DSM 46306]
MPVGDREVGAGPDEQGAPREQLVEQDAGRVDIRRAARASAADQLRRHVERCAEQSGRLPRALIHHRGDPEVRHPHDIAGAGLPRLGEEHIVRLDVAVRDPLLVRGGERVEDLGRHRQGIRRGERLRLAQGVAQ